MKFFNTMSRELEEFVPLTQGEARMYTCGPTVYDVAHIGNFRAYVFEDILRRHLKWSGYAVTQVMNLTDVDDKTIRGAKNAGRSLNAFTATYKESFFEDLGTLSIERAEVYPAATDHVEEMKDLIQRLMDKGYAYHSEDGSVYYDVGKFPGYGKLSHIDTSGLQAGARVAQDEYEKEHVADFALWKGWSEADGDVVWDSPWGRGRPGWHIECSAMSIKYLGETFDIHTGGVDNMFPHHENEIAQTEGATGVTFVNYWLHNAHLRVEGEKMSKSCGNFFTLRDLLKQGYTGREIRYVLLSGHYRQTLNFTFEALKAARTSLQRLDEFRRRMIDVAGAGDEATTPDWADSGREAFKKGMDDDLNMPEALRALYGLVHAGNRAADRGDLDAAAAAGVLVVLDDLDSVLGVLGLDDSDSPSEIDGFLAARAAARVAKDWVESDRIRDELAGMGWDVRDGADGQVVRRLMD